MRAWWLGLAFSAVGCGGLDPGRDGGSSSNEKSCIVANARCEDGVTADGCRDLSQSTNNDVLFKDGQSCADQGYTMTCAGKPGKYKTCD